MKTLSRILPLLLILCIAQSACATTARATAAYLRDIHTGKDIRTLAEGATLSDASTINIRVSATDTHSMWLTLDGPAGRVGKWYQGASPWCAPADAKTLALPAGAYTLTATPYRSDNGTYGAGAKLYRHFSVSAPVPVPPVTQPTTEPTTEPSPPTPPPVPSGILITTASQLHSIGAKSGAYLLQRGQTYDLSTLGQINISAPNVTITAAAGSAPKPKILYRPGASAVLLNVYGSGFTFSGIDTENNNRVRWLSPHASGTTIRDVTFSGTLFSFVESTSSSIVNDFTLDKVIVPFPVDSYGVYWACPDLLHPVYSQNWRFTGCEFNSSLNQHLLRLKGVANLTVNGGKYYATINKHSIANLQGVDGSTWTGVSLKGVLACFTADENPDSVEDALLSPLVARNIYFNGCTWDTGSLRLNAGAKNVNVTGCTIRNTGPTVDCHSSSHGLPPPQAIITNTQGQYTGTSTAPGLVSGNKSQVQYTGRGNSYGGKIIP